MVLSDLQISKSYESDSDDILNEFYLPVLSNSVEYQRSAGFFSSSSLAVAAKGISSFISNGGRMKLLCGAKLQKNDIEIILKAIKTPEEVIEESMINDLENIEDNLIKNHVQALGWMVANNLLEIRIAILLDDDGIPLSQENGMLHQKIGILKDSENNLISFSGSNNETATGWVSNIEEFKVFRSWEMNEKEYLDADLKKFEKYWNGTPHKMRIIDIPTGAKEKLIQIAPKDIQDLNRGERKQKEDKIELWDYQKQAIDNWIKNGRKGIFEMATGTGKTFTALGCIQDTLKNFKDTILIVACPSQHLVKQWKNQLKRFGLNLDEIIIADSSNIEWKNQLTDSLIDLSLNYINSLAVLTTHRTLSSKNFRLIMENNNSDSILLVADEVHGLGAEISSEGLQEKFNFRLGLSATPERWFDEWGTEKITEYFGGVIYEFSLEKAINTINPATGDNYLTQFKYLPKFVSLNEEELDDYIDISKKIAKQYHLSKENNNDQIFKKLLFARSNIIKNAENKLKVFIEILAEIGEDIKGTIVYCSAQQIDEVMDIINQKRIKVHRFTMKESARSNKKFSNVSEREFILKRFEDDFYKILVAMKCLDEGVDIPPAYIGILLASSGNPREYIQRIGRLIRRYPDKNEAIIYDIVVIPSLKNLPKDIREIERKIFENEIERCEEIAKAASNSAEALSLLYDIKK